MAATALLSVVAARVLALREQTRINQQAPASKAGLSQVELKVLRARFAKRAIKTVGDVALAVGKLGGHLNRKCDGMPGWKTLWLGFLILDQLVTGYEIAQKPRAKI